MYRCRLEELRKEKGYSYKKWSEESGVSIDTINRIIHPENPDKDSPRINTLEDLCRPLGVELWEIFYVGDRSFVDLQAELAALKAEHDALNSSVQKKNCQRQFFFCFQAGLSRQKYPAVMGAAFRLRALAAATDRLIRSRA